MKLRKKNLFSKQTALQISKKALAFRNGSFSAAVASFRAAIKNDPKNAKYWSHLSLAFTRIKNGFEDAEKASIEVISLEPREVNHRINLGMIYMKKGLKEKALEWFKQVLLIDPGNMKAKKGIEKIRE